MYFDIVEHRRLSSLGEIVKLKKKPTTEIVTGVPQPTNLVRSYNPATGMMTVTAAGVKGLYKPITYAAGAVLPVGVTIPKIYTKPPVVGTTKPLIYTLPPTIEPTQPKIYQPPPTVTIVAPPTKPGLPPTITVPSTPIITPGGTQVEVPVGQPVQVVTPSGRVTTVDAATVAASQPAQEATLFGIPTQWLLIGAVAFFVLPNLLKGGRTRTRTVYRRARRRKR
jgi:hypothetical protein